MGAYRLGAQYTASCVYYDTDVNVKMGVNAQNDFRAAFLVFNAISRSKAVASPNDTEGQDTQGAEKAFIRSLTAGRHCQDERCNRPTGQRKGMTSIPARVRLNAAFEVILD